MLGLRGEQLAQQYLRKVGYVIWKKNWRRSYGEIDIVAYHGRTLCFIEVKTRRLPSQPRFTAIMAVDASKTDRLERLSRDFIRHAEPQLRRRRITAFRLEVVTVTFRNGGAKPLIEIFRQDAERRWRTMERRHACLLSR